MKIELKIKEKITTNTELIGSVFVVKTVVQTSKGLQAKAIIIGHNLEFKFINGN